METPIQRLEREFRDFDRANPHIETQLVTLARRWRLRHPGRTVGMRMLWEVMRWNLSTRTVTAGDDFKLNDHHPPFYARKLMAHYPELNGIFDTRGRDDACACSTCVQPHAERRAA